jgi:hypothetical protein
MEENRNLVTTFKNSTPAFRRGTIVAGVGLLLPLLLQFLQAVRLRKIKPGNRACDQDDFESFQLSGIHGHFLQSEKLRAAAKLRLKAAARTAGTAPSHFGSNMPAQGTPQAGWLPSTFAPRSSRWSTHRELPNAVAELSGCR